MRADVIASAGRPHSRIGLLVRPLRWFAWRLLRPFHMYEMQLLATQGARLRELTAAHELLRLELETRKSAQLDLVNLDDGLLLVKRGDLISDALVAGKGWDHHVLLAAAETALARNSMAVDVGAHLGLMTLSFSRMFSHVLSFEPNLFNFNMLRANVALNGITNVTLFSHALYSHPVELSLSAQDRQEVPLTLRDDGTFDGDMSANLGAYSFDEHGTGVFQNEARTLDSFELADVAFVKVDVQGADGEVLLGSIETIRRCRPVVVFEWETRLSEGFSVTLDRVLTLFNSLEYDVDILLARADKQVDYIARPRSKSGAPRDVGRVRAAELTARGAN